jgi:uncharacterized protein YdaU (DUF1376 family)
MTAPYMPLFVADYLADTAHLTAAEHGAYLMLVMNYWQRGKPLPADDKKLARIARMSDAEWLDARSTIAEFFVEADGAWTHKRVDAELAVAEEKTSKAKKAARISAEVRKANAEQTLSERSTDAELLGEARLGEEREDTGKPASSGAGQPEIDLEDAERRCSEAAGSNRLGSFGPVAEILIGGKLGIDEVLVVIRSRPARGGSVSSWKFYAKILADKIAERAPSSPSAIEQVFIARDSPGWLERCMASGHKPSMTTQHPSTKVDGWWFKIAPATIEAAA